MGGRRMKLERGLMRIAVPVILAVGLVAAIGSPAGAGAKPKATGTLYVAPPLRREFHTARCEAGAAQRKPGGGGGAARGPGGGAFEPRTDAAEKGGRNGFPVTEMRNPRAWR